MPAKKLRPELDGHFWRIGPNPYLGALQGLTPEEAAEAGKRPQECVDHHVFQSDDAMWQLWACIRHTKVGRILYRWESSRLETVDWRLTGESIRCDAGAGESLDDYYGEEWLQSPYVIEVEGTYYMFYGGHGTGIDSGGRPRPSVDGRRDPLADCQICLMTSPDGRSWKRHHNGRGQSRLFLGPGETRDPCLIKIDGLWHMYYAGYHDGDPLKCGFYLRTSSDLIRWSDWQLVHFDTSGRFGSGGWNCECPHVVTRGGYYYLFRTEDYNSAATHVFRSADPRDFGIGDASAHYVGPLAVAAPEIILSPQGGEYITSNHHTVTGTEICRLRWVDDA